MWATRRTRWSPAPVRLVTIALVGGLAAIAVWNSLHYDVARGFDAQPHLEYAKGLVERGELPDATGSYYTPPAFFVLGGVAIEVGEAFGMSHPEQLAQLLNAGFTVATAVLLLMVVREIWPRRELLHIAALAFFVACPLVLKVTAMFHPEPMSMFLSTLAMYLAVRMLSRRSFGIASAIGIGLALGLGQLTRAFALWTVACVVIAFVVFAAACVGARANAVRALVIVVIVAFAVPAPWYVHQASKYSNPLFDRPQPDEAVWKRRNLSFYVDAGMPEVVTHPYRPAFAENFLPLVYSESWGDYFGVWAWNASLGAPNEGTVISLRVQAAAGALPTILAFGGWIGLLVFALRRVGDRAPRLLVALLPLAGLAGLLYFAVSYPTPDGDTAKASYMLTAVPFWAIGFGVGIDALSEGRTMRRVLLVLVAIAFVLSLRFVVRA